MARVAARVWDCTFAVGQVLKPFSSQGHNGAQFRTASTYSHLLLSPFLSYCPICYLADSCPTPLLVCLRRRHKLIEQLNMRAFALRQQGKLVEAVREYTRALELDLGHFKTLFNRGFTYDRVSEYE